MNKPFIFFLGILLCIGMAGQASALTITNGSFETGDFTSWSPSSSNEGATNVVTTSISSGADITYSATAGTYFAELAANAALVYENLTWNDGETISFDWAFLAFDYTPYDDYAYFEVSGTTNIFHTLSSVPAVGNYGETNWATYSYTFASAGSGNIGFGVLNGIDFALNSKFLIDNVTASSAPAPVPEPATMVLFGLGLIGIAGVSKKKFQE